ncbi:DUF655 domain-containing protein [Variovorax sp. J22R133]|uniref:ComEA family DNA-binding protein n=1 Tax=Variovorax brevis TaxID=3053503 RepID=UPI00257689EE|nr:DUF655 domain-containing protein [Variovorax sp. J22R133]MDM0113549.1 DUF655 domain-containing protein [Variovorax sp. J22R133]
MFKKLLAALAMMSAAVSFAAVEVNKASAADFDGLKGVGPAMSQRILDARKQGEFKSWEDLMARVKGVKTKKAEKLSGEGLTVNGEPFKTATSPQLAAAAKPAPAKTAAAAPAAAPAK